MSSILSDDPAIEVSRRNLEAFARDVVAGKSTMGTVMRQILVDAIGIAPSPTATDVTVATHFLALCAGRD